VLPPPREVVLFVHALRLARRAQAVGRTPLPALVSTLQGTRLLPAGVDPDAAFRATVRAVPRGARWFGWLGTCLVKALVLSALLGDRDDVELVLGVRKGTGETPIDGHAWVRVGGREFSLLGPREAAGEGYLTVTALPVRRKGALPGPRG
jgi:hypothetical protein